MFNTRYQIYCVSQKEVIKSLTPCCSKSNKNLTIHVCWTNVVVFWLLFQISEKFIDHYIKYKRLKWHIYGTIFPTFVQCRSHACGFTRFEVILSKICRHCLIRLQVKRHCCCCFGSQKRHFYIKTQKKLL